jgi:hypothetical protein
MDDYTSERRKQAGRLFAETGWKPVLLSQNLMTRSIELKILATGTWNIHLPNVTALDCYIFKNF